MKTRHNLIKVSNCIIENFSIDCFLDPEIDTSYFEWPTKKEPRCQLVVGCKEKEWYEIVDAILHELMEFMCCNSKLAFHNDTSFDVSSTGRMFIFSHDDFSEIVSKAALIFCSIENIYKKKFREFRTKNKNKSV